MAIYLLLGFVDARVYHAGIREDAMRCTRVLVVILVLAVGCVAAVHRCALESIGQEQVPTSPSEVDVVGCLIKESGKLKLTDDEGNVYDLIGHTAELKNHIGDQLDVSGIQDHPPTPPKEHSLPETSLRVTNVETVVMHPSRTGHDHKL